MALDTARMRQLADSDVAAKMTGPLMRQAADEIDRLNAQLAERAEDQRLHDEFVNALLRHVPEDCEDDAAGEGIVERAMRALAARYARMRELREELAGLSSYDVDREVVVAKLDAALEDMGGGS